jgi:nucleotide-binding universal stress UspA family protein
LKDTLVVRDDKPPGGRIMVCIDGSSYCYKGMRAALEMARDFGASLYVCSAFDVEYHHVVFNNIKDVLSVQASKVFKFEEQEELHNNIIDKGLLKLCQANLKRAEVMAKEFPSVEVKTQILVGKPFQVILQWAEEIQPTLLVAARHGAHRIDGTDMGSQAENLARLAPCNLLLVGTTGIRPEDIPDREDGQPGCRGRPRPSAHPARAALRAGDRAPRGRGVCARALERRGRDRHQQVARRGDRQAAADAHAADHGHRLGRGAGARRDQGRGAAQGDEGRRPRRGPGGGRWPGRDEVPDHRPCRQPTADRDRPDRGRRSRGTACGRCRSSRGRSRATPSSASRATTASGA